MKDFNSVRKSVNERLKKQFRSDYVDTAKRLIYPRHYDRDLVKERRWNAQAETCHCNSIYKDNSEERSVQEVIHLAKYIFMF